MKYHQCKPQNPDAYSSNGNKKYTNVKKVQEELDKFAGKTGQDLLDDGWTVSGWDIDENTFTMNKDPFAYTVVIDSKLKESDDFDGDEEIKKLKIIQSVFLFFFVLFL